MKFIIANHIDDRDKRPRFWRIPEELEKFEIKVYETQALVHTRNGQKRVKVLKVIEHDQNEVYDWKVKETIKVEQEVIAFVNENESVF